MSTTQIAAYMMPTDAALRAIRNYTEGNYHTEARLVVANMLVASCADVDRTTPQAFRDFFKAVMAVEDELGHIPAELAGKRREKTREMLDWARALWGEEMDEKVRRCL